MADKEHNIDNTDELIRDAIRDDVKSSVLPAEATALAAFAHKAAMSSPEIAAAAASAAAWKIPKIIGGVIAVLGIATASVVGGSMIIQQGEDHTIEYSETTTFAPEATIEFSSEEQTESVNPTLALATTNEGTLTGWSISDSSGAVQARGEDRGEDTAEVLAELLPGNYFIQWEIESDRGAIATITREFRIE